MIAQWLDIVGIGEDGLAGLSASARTAVANAQILAGGSRHLAMVPADTRTRLPWPSPLRDGVARLVALRSTGQRICVLASGDPLCYGIASVLREQVEPDEMCIFPAPSAISLARARLAWTAQECQTVSLHGRPLATLNAHLQPGNKLILLTSDGGTPLEVAKLLCEQGFGNSKLTVFEHLAGNQEKRRSASACEWQQTRCADLNTLAIHCIADHQTPVLVRVPGLPDQAFEHDGQLTKREVRATTLSKLAPLRGELLWDVGAGCGSIGIEWLRCAPGSRAIAIEREPTRVDFMHANAQRLGTPELEIILGAAPEQLAGLERPDAIFIGGGISSENLLRICWEQLKPGGRLVANAVTVAGEAALYAWQLRHGGELSRIQIARAEPVGKFLAWRQMLPVTQLTLLKSRPKPIENDL